MGERSLMADLEAAWDEHEGTDVETESGNDALEASVEESDEPFGLDNAEVEPEPSDGTEDAVDPDDVPSETLEATEPEPESADAGQLDSPPRGLTAAQREAWKDTPQAIRKAMHKRAEDYSRGIEKHAAQARKGTMMDQVFQPYQQLFAMTGQQPPQLVSTLLQTAAVLQMGAPQQKALAVASIVNDYGIDIRALDSALAGKEPQQSPEQNIQSQVDQRMQQWTQQQQQMQRQATQQAETNQIKRELQAFASDPKNEFYNDVKNLMAMWMEESSRNPSLQGMTLKQAYDRACESHPEVAKIIRARQGQELARRKAPAGSSVHGTPGGGGSSKAPSDLRGSLEWAWDNAGRM